MAHKAIMRRVASLLAGVVLVAGTVAAAAPVELTLDDSIAMALKNNPQIKMADANVMNAQGLLDQAVAGGRPVITVGHTDSRGESRNSLTGSYVIGNNFDNKLSLTLPLYTGGRLESSIEQAKTNYQSSLLGVDKTARQLKLDTTTAYYNVLQARNLVKVAQESVDNLAEHLKNVQAQYAVGTVAKSDVLRSEVELANAQQNLIKAKNNYDLAVTSLENIIGLPLGTELTLKEELAYTPVKMTLDQALDIALANRPELKQAQLGIQSAQYGLKVAQSGSRPTVNFTAYNDWNDHDFPGLDNSTWGMSVIASWNVFDSGLTKSKIKQAQAGIDQAQAQAKYTRDNVVLDVQQAYLSLKEAEKRIQTTQVAVDKAQEDYNIAQVRYSAGVGTNLDVMDAQVALTQAKTNYIQALYDYNTSRAKLEKAIGAPVQ